MRASRICRFMKWGSRDRFLWSELHQCDFPFLNAYFQDLSLCVYPLLCLPEIPTMREVKFLVLLACLLTGEATFALGLRQPQHVKQACNSTSEIGVTTRTSSTFSLANGTVLEMSPTEPHPILRPHKASPTRRKLGGFRECSPCTCCDSTRRWCLPTVCCYQINCGVRDLPFGICSFTPISCSCLGCRD